MLEKEPDRPKIIRLHYVRDEVLAARTIRGKIRQ
jgi:hypothetical protein